MPRKLSVPIKRKLTDSLASLPNSVGLRSADSPIVAGSSVPITGICQAKYSEFVHRCDGPVAPRWSVPTMNVERDVVLPIWSRPE